MSSIVFKTPNIGFIVGVSVVDEIFDLFTISLVILAFVLIVNLGLDIEESIAPVFATFSAMALVGW